VILKFNQNHDITTSRRWKIERIIGFWWGLNIKGKEKRVNAQVPLQKVNNAYNLKK
jgi:hypothetical protein